MRILFLLLVLANVAFFAWARFIAAGGSGADPAPLSRQIEPGKLRVVPPEELAHRSAPKPVAVASAPASPAPATLKCVEWGSFTANDAARAEKALEPLALGARMTRRTIDETTSWWVFIPPQDNEPNVRQAALRKAGELKKLGVQDYFIVQEEGPQRWAVSLGVFRSEEAAQAHLAGLRAQGVNSARIAPRHSPRVWLQIKGTDATLQSRLQELARGMEGSELRDCPRNG